MPKTNEANAPKVKIINKSPPAKKTNSRDRDVPTPVNDIAPIITPMPDNKDIILAIISPIFTIIFNH